AHLRVRVAQLLGVPAHEHTPAGRGAVDLERHLGLEHGGVELGAGCGAEDDVAVHHRVVDGQDHEILRELHGDPSQCSPTQQYVAVDFGELADVAGPSPARAVGGHAAFRFGSVRRSGARWMTCMTSVGVTMPTRLSPSN